MKSLVDRWYSSRPPLLWLPLSWLFLLLIKLRLFLYKLRLLRSYQVDAPVIVVGNITVGGTGKTPLVTWLVTLLKKAGYKPGIVTRGYGGKAERWPQQVRPDSDPVVVGDEPVLLAQRCDCPIVASPNRVEAAQALLKHSECDIIITDDGLQHYRLQRDIEIVVVDGDRRFGNRSCLPAGPLREPLSRLKSVDYIVTNGMAGRGEFAMKLTPSNFISLTNPQQSLALTEFKGKTVHAIAGIGNPQRFFNLLKSHGIEVVEHPFEDHYAYSEQDLAFGDQLPVLMTEKDAVKCRRIARSNNSVPMWYLPVEAQLDEAFALSVLGKLKKLKT